MYGTSLPRDSRFPWTGTIPNRHIVRNVTTTAQHAAHNTARCNTTRTITIMHHTAYNTNIDCISLSHIYVSIKSSNPTVQYQYVNPYLTVYLYRSHLTCIHTLIYHMPQKPETKNKQRYINYVKLEYHEKIAYQWAQLVQSACTSQNFYCTAPTQHED